MQFIQQNLGSIFQSSKIICPSHLHRTTNLCKLPLTLKRQTYQYKRQEGALDDFGTGYATYRYLQAFPVDFIKIDKSFVQMASVDEISGHIVDNIVELARKPGLSIVAEGVETQEQADLMIGKGVHFLQGYLYSPPVPGNKFVSDWVMKAGG